MIICRDCNLKTRSEKNDYLQRLQSQDPMIIKEQLDNIIAIGKSGDQISSQIGHDIINEILVDEKQQDSQLPALSHLYIDAYLHERHGLARALSQAISNQGQLFGEFANESKRIIKRTIEEDRQVKACKNSMLMGQSDNLTEVKLMEQGILSLARFYELDKHLKPKEATELAIKELITKSYIKPLGDLMIPATIVENGELIQLDVDNLNYNLNKLRRDLINGKVPYGQVESFGFNYTDGNQKYLKEEIQEILRNGQFKLTKDKKSLYFSYVDETGEHPLFMLPDIMFTIPLILLNDQVPSLNNEELFNTFNLNILNLNEYDLQ